MEKLRLIFEVKIADCLKEPYKGLGDTFVHVGATAIGG